MKQASAQVQAAENQGNQASAQAQRMRNQGNQAPAQAQAVRDQGCALHMLRMIPIPAPRLFQQHRFWQTPRMTQRLPSSYSILQICQKYQKKCLEL